MAPVLCLAQQRGADGAAGEHVRPFGDGRQRGRLPDGGGTEGAGRARSAGGGPAARAQGVPRRGAGRA
eukprot:3360609-Pyramimonas_sp.AAC.1